MIEEHSENVSWFGGQYKDHLSQINNYKMNNYNDDSNFWDI